MLLAVLLLDLPHLGNICLAKVLKVFAPSHLVSYLQDHAALPCIKIFFKGVLFDSLTLSCDQCKCAVRGEDIHSGHDVYRRPGCSWDVLLWKSQIPGGLFSELRQLLKLHCPWHRFQHVCTNTLGRVDLSHPGCQLQV